MSTNQAEAPVRIGVFISRMQPLHMGHLSVLQTMSQECDHMVLCIGSANKARSVKNPFLVHEREAMLASVISHPEAQLNGDTSASIVRLPDFTYNNEMWLETTQQKVQHEIDHYMDCEHDEDKKYNICLYGHDQGNDTKYLHQFPQWHKRLTEKEFSFHAKDIRHSLFFDRTGKDIRPMLAPGVADFIDRFIDESNGEEVMDSLIEEAELVKKIQSDKTNYTYPIIDQTVDAVVVCNGHVLMVTRGINPGKGQLALPGGYLGEYEDIPDAIIRELKEETKINLDKRLLSNILNDERIVQFSAPGRSVRGRVITSCGLIHLQLEDLPKVKGSDDAKGAQWVPLHELDSLSTNIFEDHYCIIRCMLGYCKKTD